MLAPNPDTHTRDTQFKNLQVADDWEPIKRHIATLHQKKVKVTMKKNYILDVLNCTKASLTLAENIIIVIVNEPLSAKKEEKKSPVMRNKPGLDDSIDSSSTSTSIIKPRKFIETPLT
jgi:hypothetical protein